MISLSNQQMTGMSLPRYGNNTCYPQDKNLILSEVNIDVKKGDFVYLIGKTGSGKSSLLKTLYGDLKLNHGKGEIVGFNLEALKDKKGIRRYAHAYVPLDEALSRVVIDCSGRPGLEYNANYPRARVGDFDVDLIFEFFQGFVNHAMMTLHIDNIRGRNSHHIAETIFKAFGRSLRIAVEIDPAMKDILPSTKGSL